ncbi:hypothetical protein GOP47_0001671 [Adiantum capillus-veneris]|uniref:Uncharacterized protein n=1 Tax=Adiantum capillus-veneris TaxID=13818 RepID=A0A9D4V953_ADICA|nr:hypothetical protein GOP47_0001671 [Adiantum capillus-veneris]
MDKVLPASQPGHFNEMLYVDGPPLSVGNTFIVTYHEDIPHYNFVKCRWDEMNHEEHHFKCTLIDGGALNKHFSHLAYTLNILPDKLSEGFYLNANGMQASTLILWKESHDCGF